MTDQSAKLSDRVTILKKDWNRVHSSNKVHKSLTIKFNYI
jgi:hypothetical protein